MTREDAIMGLNDWAEKFVSRTGVHRIETEDYMSGLIGEYPLHEYTLPDGMKYREAIQANPEKSGPYFFLALKNEKGNWIPRSLWLKDDMDLGTLDIW